MRAAAIMVESMKSGLWLVAASVALLLGAGCGKSSDGAAGSTNAASGNPLTAPTDYLGAAAKAKQSSEKTIDTISINQAIALFHASEGRFPKDLNELVAEKYLPKLPEAPYGTKIVYDADRGQVRIVPK
jgi:hypothetical protein